MRQPTITGSSSLIGLIGMSLTRKNSTRCFELPGPAIRNGLI